MKTPNIKQFQAWAKSHKDLALAVCASRAIAAVERERVDAYIKPVFESFNFQYSGDLAEKCKLSGPVPSQKDLYLLPDDVVAPYYAACDVAHRAHGFDGPAGYCPALIAENMVMEAERALIESGSVLMGLESCNLIYGDTREKFLKILLGACLVGHERKAA